MTQVADDGRHGCLEGLLVVSPTPTPSEPVDLLIALELVDNIRDDGPGLLSSRFPIGLERSVSGCLGIVVTKENHVILL